MTNLERALIASEQADSEREANEIVRKMFERVKNFEDPEDVLEDYDLEGDYIDDILGWKQYGTKRNEDSDRTNPIPGSSNLAPKDEEKMSLKIKALLDKANSTDSQAEKDAFMMKAQELIQKHGLEVTRILAVKGEKKNGVITSEPILEEIINYNEEWDRQLMNNIGKGNMCQILFDSGKKNIHIIGRESNCQSVVMLCDFYRKAILNLAVDAAKRKTRMSKMLLTTGGKKMTGKEIARIEKEEVDNINDYLFGAVNGLDDALTKKIVMFESETFSTGSASSSGTELMITGKDVMRQNRDKIMEYIDKKYPYRGLFRCGGGGNSDSYSYSRGFADGGGLGAGQKRLG